MKTILLLIGTLLVVGCATKHTPLVQLEPTIQSNKRTKASIQKTKKHQEDLTESQVKVSGALQSVLDDLNKLLNP